MLAASEALIDLVMQDRIVLEWVDKMALRPLYFFL